MLGCQHSSRSFMYEFSAVLVGRAYDVFIAPTQENETSDSSSLDTPAYRRGKSDQLCCTPIAKLLEQAAQGLEPELLVPISVVLTRSELSETEQQNRDSADPNSYNYHPLSITPQLVLCGDTHQRLFFC